MCYLQRAALFHEQPAPQGLLLDHRPAASPLRKVPRGFSDYQTWIEAQRTQVAPSRSSTVAPPATPLMPVSA